MQIRARFIGKENDAADWITGRSYTLVIDGNYVSIENHGGFHYDVEDFLKEWVPLEVANGGD